MWAAAPPRPLAPPSRAPARVSCRPPVRRAVPAVRASTLDDVDALPIAGVARSGDADGDACTVSPVCEGTARTLARDLLRRRVTLSRYAPAVSVRDAGGRRFTGVAGYERDWVVDLVVAPEVSIDGIRFADRRTVAISWSVAGTVNGAPFAADVTSTYSLDQVWGGRGRAGAGAARARAAAARASFLPTPPSSPDQVTGRVSTHDEAWNLSRTPASARLPATAARAAWTVARAGEDVARGGAAFLESLSSYDEDAGPDIQADPTDPTKFFQQDDSTMRDALVGGGERGGGGADKERAREPAHPPSRPSHPFSRPSPPCWLSSGR